jgi:A/G-specific adenine glycosylase
MDSEIPDSTAIGEFRECLQSWFQQHGRHFPWRNKSATNYQRILAELLLQRTQAETVAIFFPKFVKRFPSWRKLAKASEEELQEMFKPIGLWRRRSASLYKLANEIANKRGRFPREREELEALPGVGQYIANAVLMFCYGEPQPLLDASMARVLERYFGPRKLVDIRYDPYLQSLAKEVVDGDSPALVNWAMLDLAALVCTLTDPQCRICPLADGCRFARDQDST